MSEFINTIDVLGDDAVTDSIIDRSITEFKDNVITKIGGYAFSGCTALETVDLPNVTLLGSDCFVNCTALTMLEFPNIAGELLQYSYLIGNCGGGDGYGNNPSKTYLKLPRVTKMGTYAIVKFSPMVAEFSLPVTFSASAFGYGCCGYLVLRGETLSTALGSPFSGGIRNDILAPRSLIDSYKVATNWSNYADQFKAIEDYTVDGTTTGEFVRCSGVELDKTSLTFDGWKTQTLTATTLTPSPFGWDTVKWRSADASIAAVNNGVVRPVSKGTTIITANCNGYSATCEVTVNAEGIPMLYSLAEPTTFNGSSDYIDTGIQLFDTAKDFTIICEAEFSKLANERRLFHCMNEASPYPGISIDGNSGVRICYTGSSSITTSISNRSDVSTLAIRYVDGKMNAIRYRNASGNIVTHAVSGTPTYTKVTQNLLLGAYQTTAGVKGRFFNGTISRFDVYPTALSDEQIEAFL